MGADTIASVSETDGWWAYLERISGSESQAAIARRLDVDKTTVWRWKANGVVPDTATVIRIARTYGRPVAEALAAAGYITPEEAAVTETIVKTTPAELTTDELLDEIRRRLAN